MTGSGDTTEIDIGKAFWIFPVRMIGLVATVYLVWYALFLIFLAIVFSPPLDSNFVEAVSFVAKNATPAVFYTGVGAVAFVLVSKRRLWAIGLLATSAQVLMATYAFVHSGSIPLFTDWLV